MDESSVINNLVLAFPGTIDPTTLSNWQVELEPGELEHVFLTLNPAEISQPYLIKLLQSLGSNEFDVLSDFKAVILDILNELASTSMQVRIEISKQTELLVNCLLQRLINDLANNPTKSTPTTPPDVNGYIKLITTTLPHNCDTRALLSLFKPLIISDKWHNKHTQDLILNLLLSIFAISPHPVHLLNSNAPLVAPITHLRHKELTAQFWIHLNHDQPVPLFALALSTSNLSSLSVSWKNHKIIVQLNLESKSSEYMFNQAVNGIAYLVISYDSYKNLSFYLNGEYSESIPCPELHRVIHNWDKIYLGGDNANGKKMKNEILFGQFTLLSTTLSPEWISLLYNLGQSYLWDNKELTDQNILLHFSQLTYTGHDNFIVHCREYLGTADSKKIASRLATSKVKQNQVVFDSSGLEFYHPRTSFQALFSIGGSSLLLKVFQLTENPTKLLKLLLQVISNDWRIAREFELLNGYSILSILVGKAINNGNEDVKKDILQVLLTYSGYNYDNALEAKIINSYLIKIVLNFEVFNPDDVVKEKITSLLTGRYYLENTTTLLSLSLVGRLIHHLKARKEGGEELLEIFLKLEPNVETVRSITHFVIFALYGKENLQEVGEHVAIGVMKNFSVLETAKKLKKAITIHWILLLLSYKGNSEVPKTALKFLAILLLDIGPQTVVKFFDNHGVDILLNSLGDSWKDPDVLTATYDSAFYKGSFVLPKFFIVLNGLVSNAIASKTKSRVSSPVVPRRNSQHDWQQQENKTIYATLTQYQILISHAFGGKPEVRTKLYSKEFLDSFFFVLSKLQYLSDDPQFKDIFNQLIDTILEAFIELIMDYSLFLMAYNPLSEFTKKLILNWVFPRIFNHIIQFLPISSDEEFANICIKLMHLYFHEFIQAGYSVGKNLEVFIKCAFIVLDGRDVKINGIGPLIIKWAATENFKNCLTELLYRLMVVLNDKVLSDSLLLDLIVVLIGRYVERGGPEDTLFNFLRTCVLARHDQLPKLANVKYPSQDLDEFFNVMISRNDDETCRYLSRHGSLCSLASKKFHGAINQTSSLSIAQMVSAMIDTPQNVHSTIQSFSRDCDQLKSHIIRNEIIKFNRASQDQHEANKHCLMLYSSLTADISRILQPIQYEDNAQYLLDYIEGSDRMRKRMIMEDNLADEEKLAYNMPIPIRYDEESTPEANKNGSASSFLSQSIDVSLGNEEEEETFEMVEGESMEERNRQVLRQLYLGDHITSLRNVGQINGLSVIESLLIVGKSHLYLLENYFHSEDMGVVNIEDAPKSLRDPYIQLINNSSKDSGESVSSGTTLLHRRKAWNLDSLACISKRQFLLRNVAIEMFFSDGASVLITCRNPKERDYVFASLNSYVKGGIDQDYLAALSNKESGLQGLAAKMASLATGATSSMEAITSRWKAGKISNFSYIMLINTFAGRTFNDLTQYPIFPWVLADYTSKELDLTDPKTFRDLLKPMGAQNPVRAQQFKDRYEALEGDVENPPFHYGTHYSLAMIVTLYLVRLQPYVQLYLLLQGGRFDHADRLFNLVSRVWQLSLSDSTTDVRELTPEFFYLPEFLVNLLNFELGKLLHTGQITDDVILPPWANGDPSIFVAKHREALESPYVLKHLHQWIDLIFGYKQLGPEAVKAVNVFHHLLYLGAINVDTIDDEREKRAVIGTINNFGQTPNKVFNRPHMPREVLNAVSKYLSLPKFEPKRKRDKEQPKLFIKCIGLQKTSLLVNLTIYWNIHTSRITAIEKLGPASTSPFIVGFEDGTLSVWKISEANSLEFLSILRGHHSSVKFLCCSKTFHIAASIDEEGKMILWDVERFKFIRTIRRQGSKMACISDESGNICVVSSSGKIRVLTINGDTLYRGSIANSEAVTCVLFAGTAVNSKSSHVYWNDEFLIVGHGGTVPHIDIYRFSLGWNLNRIISWPTVGTQIGKPIKLEVNKITEIDYEEKIARGKIGVLIYDDKGKVFETN